MDSKNFDDLKILLKYLESLDIINCSQECERLLCHNNVDTILESINRKAVDINDNTEIKPFYPVLKNILNTFGDIKNTVVLALGILASDADDEEAFDLIDKHSKDDLHRHYFQVTYFYGKGEVDLCFDIIVDNALFQKFPRLCYSVAIKLFAKDPYQSTIILDELKNVDDNALSGVFLPMLHNELYESNKISLVVAVRNRTDNLIKCFPSWFNIDLINEYIIIDFSSDESLLENPTISSWVDTYGVKVVRVEGETQFNLGKAYNLAFDYATNNNVLKIDADYINLDSSWLKQFAIRQPESKYFIHGHFDFGFHLSGLCFMRKHIFKKYREDLSGYGYDEVDMYQRCQDAGAKPILFFDASKYVKHLGHTTNSRSSDYNSKDIEQSELFNRELCQKHSTKKPLRNEYSVHNNIVVYEQQRIQNVFCINLDNRIDRWEAVSEVYRVKRFSAVDAKANPTVYKEFNLQLLPIDISSKLYFKFHKGAIGAFLSHYNLWKHIVEQDLDYTLVIEDDVKPTSVNHILESNLIFKDLDFVQLSKRIRNVNDRYMFDGGESYIVSKVGASKLINAVHFPLLLGNVFVDKFKEVKYLTENKNIEDPNLWPNIPAITCPVDKLMGYCCQNAASDLCRLSNIIYPFVDLNDETSNISDINELSNSWTFSQEQVEHIIKTGGI
jgi:glycosyltransferase involved in cell wall biosynthesis